LTKKVPKPFSSKAPSNIQQTLDSQQLSFLGGGPRTKKNGITTESRAAALLSKNKSTNNRDLIVKVSRFSRKC